MDDRPKPGRNPDGTFATNDHTSGQAMKFLADALDAHMAGEDDLARTLLEDARAAARLTDAGQHPATEDHGDG